MPSKFLTSSFDSRRRKKEESGMSHRGHLWLIGLIFSNLKELLRLIFVLYLFMHEDY